MAAVWARIGWVANLRGGILASNMASTVSRVMPGFEISKSRRDASYKYLYSGLNPPLSSGRRK